MRKPLWLLLVWLCCHSVFAAETRPNLLLIVTDDQGYWDLSATGNPTITTPNLDSIARDGVQFTRFYVQPVCSPTRAGLMTGRYYLRTGLYNTRFGGDSMGLGETTLAEALKQSGYRTGLFGKWHLGQYHGYQPQQRGFDEFLGHYHGHIERYEYADQLVHNGQPVETRGYVADLFTDAAMEFIDTTTRTKKSPFFCYLAFNTPHSPHILDTSHLNQAKGDALIEKYQKLGLPIHEARIYAQVERIDQNIGRLLAHLKEAGLAENTAIAYMSDNGGVSKYWQGGMRGNKASVYEGGVRSPLFVRWPGHFPAGTKVTAQASHVDIFPTFCELAGATIPSDRTLDGLSLLPLLKAGHGEQLHPYIYSTWNRFFPDADERWSISDPQFKLLGQFGSKDKADTAKWQLYDLMNDPGEQKNVAAKHPDKVKALRAEFVRWFNEVTKDVKYAPVPIPIGHQAGEEVEIQGSWATLKGEKTEYIFEAYDWDSIEGWSQPGDAAEWQLQIARGGRYEVSIAYACLAADVGGKLKLGVGRQALEFSPEATPSGNVFQRTTVGTINLRSGPAILRAEVLDAPGKELMKLNRVWLKRLP